MNLTPDETQALAQRHIPEDAVVLIEAGVTQIQVLGVGGDAAGNPVTVFGFMAGLPRDFLRPKSVIFGAQGQPIGGGLPEAMPVPPTIRLLVRLDAINPAYRPAVDASPPAAGDGTPHP